MREANRNAAKRNTTNEPPPWIDWDVSDRASHAIRWIEEYCTITAGYGSGQKIRLAEWQKTWLRSIYQPGITTAVLSCPRGQGKSTLLSCLSLYSLFNPDPSVGTPQIPIVATRIQQITRTVYQPLLRMVDVHPELLNRTIRYSAIGASRLVAPFNGGELFCVSSDLSGLQGLSPTFACLDEVGFQSGTWEALSLAGGKRPLGLLIGIGTPGVDRENDLYRLRTLVRSGVELPGFSYTEFSAEPGHPVGDREQWHRANPSLAEGFLSESALETSLATSPEAEFRIFRLGQSDIEGVDGWLGSDGAALWSALERPYKLVQGGPAYVGVDVGIKRDSTSVVTVQYRADEPTKLHAVCKLWIPTKEEPVDVTDVMEYLRKQCAIYKVGAVSYDPRFFDVPAKMLYDSGLPMVEIPQSVERMTQVIGATYEAILNGGITHDKDDGFTTQVLNAVPRFSERGFTLQKSKSRGRIDAAIALSLAVDRAQHKTKPRQPFVVL